MKTDTMSLYTLFDSTQRYVVPLFQRPYVWEEEGQWVPLWEDITGRAEAVLKHNQNDRIGNHFLGAVVLNQIMVSGRQVHAVHVIDGQQRLTTLQLVIAAFRDLVANIEEKEIEGIYDNLLGLTENKGRREKEEEIFKVWPTNADRQDFMASMSARSLDALLKQYPPQRRPGARKPDPRPRLVEAYKFFSEAIQEFCFVPAEQLPVAEGQNQDEGDAKSVLQLSAIRTNALFDALQKYIQLVVINLEDGDDPQVIFETLNDRGVRLLPSDLIRNFVFLRAIEQSENTEDLYVSQWSEYDERPAEADAGKDKRFWKQMERQGRIRLTRLDLFVHHYVQYRSGQDFSIGHLYNAFRTWWEKNEERKVAHELAEMRRHSNVFARLFVPEGDSRVDIFAKRLRAIDTSMVYPVLLMLLVGRRDCIESSDELDGIITDLESYLVRRMVCNLGTKNYNRFFLSLLEHLRDAEKISRSLVQEFLRAPKGPAAKWPNDKEFSQAWLQDAVYETMKATKCSMVLSAIDKAMCNAKGDEVTINKKLTVEHVLPQKWESSDWPLESETGPESEETAIEHREQLLHSLGNLTLLTQELNSSVSNGPYDVKRPEIAKQSALRINTHFQETMKWNEDEIQRRGRILLEEAKKIWPYPGKEG